MCAISGVISLNGKKIVVPDIIYEMMKKQHHRGPDDQGAIAFDWNGIYEMKKDDAIIQTNGGGYNGLFGFNRLSILDLSNAGHQPMLDGAKNVALIFNGEIYNAFELKKELKDYNFKSKTDTEVILALYLRYGFFKMVKKLNGMFGLAILDLKLHKCFIARDRFGIKPVYYSIQDDFFYFSSEYKAISSLSMAQNSLNMEAVAEYFNFRGSLTRTLMKNVNPVLPGEILIVDGNCVKHEFFYQLLEGKVPEKNIYTEDIIQKKISDMLRRSVKSQLVSDVPLGCQLSGGIDSSLITYFGADMAKNLMSSVSIIFNDERFSEEKWIDTVGEKIKIQQFKYLFDTTEFINLLERTVWHQEGILSHPNSICLQYLTKKAKENVTVLLSGEGADELFAGYARFALCDDMTNSQIIDATKTIESDKLKKLIPNLNSQRIFEERLNMIENIRGDSFTRQRKYEMLTYLPELLVRQDKMSMSNSIENRVPFLDNDLVDFVLKLPSESLITKIKDNIVTKYPLKVMSEKIFGYDFTYRKKMGFSVPVQNYIKNKSFRDYFYEVIIPKARTRGVCNADELDELYCGISKEKYDYHKVEAFWRGLTLEIWCQLYLDKRDVI